MLHPQPLGSHSQFQACAARIVSHLTPHYCPPRMFRRLPDFTAFPFDEKLTRPENPA